MLETIRRCALAPDAYPARSEVLGFLGKHWRLVGLTRSTRDFLLAAIRCTRPDDWMEGGQPRCWAHNEWFMEQLTVTETAIRRNIRRLAEGGFVAPFDRPNCHRRAPRRGSNQSWGYLDLSPIQHAWADWWRAAIDHEKRVTECEAIREDVARSHFRLLENIVGVGASEDAPSAKEQMRRLMSRRRRLTDPDALKAIAVQAERLAARFARPITADQEKPCTSKTTGKIGGNDGHYTESFIKKSTGMARAAAPIRIEQCGVGKADLPAGASSELGRDRFAQRRDDDRRKSNLPPTVLLRLCPPLRDCVATARPDSTACIDGAQMLAHMLGVAQPIWAEACLTLGRYRAATAVAILATRIAEGARVRSASAYLLAQCRREERGELFLARSLQRLRYELRRQTMQSFPCSGASP
ncbi:replicator initiator RepC [Gluconacetobacter sacchari DSM 12717]|nr:replicator initiator RepC [Gluconacetobacter sacchari DSM 12717]